MKNIQIGIAGRAESGKSTFVAANVKGKTLVFDSDGRWASVAPLAEGATFTYADKAAVVKPIVMADELDRILVEDFEMIIVDSVTKIYSIHARRASMQGRLSNQERSQRGLTAKYRDMIDKADAMQLLANIPAYGAGVFYIWHRGDGLNVNKRVASAGEYDTVEVDKISEIELNTLKASMSMVLKFQKQADGYYATVESARAITNRAPRTGFSVRDYPGNFWAGGLDRITDLVYTHFSSQDEALAWVAFMLGGEADDYVDFYNDTKDTRKPQNASMMWFHLIDRAYDEKQKRKGDQESEPAVKMPHPSPDKVVVEKPRPKTGKVLEPVTADPSPQTAYAETPPMPEEAPPEPEAAPDEPTAEELFDNIPDRTPEPEDRSYRVVTLASGETVDEKAWLFYWKYKDTYDKEPHNLSDIRNAGKHEGWF